MTRRHRFPRARFALFIAASAGSVLLATAPASASLFCNPKQTADGFVALRFGPSPAARLIARMKASDEVQIGQRRQGKWQEVRWWRGDDRLDKPGQPPAGEGWVHRDLIQDNCG